MFLRFVGDAVYDGVLLYRKGSLHDVTEENGFANRWIKRGLAVPESKPEVSSPVKGHEAPVMHTQVEETLESDKESEQDTNWAGNKNNGKSKNKNKNTPDL